jgi:hypothetical protein
MAKRLFCCEHALYHRAKIGKFIWPKTRRVNARVIYVQA